MIINDSIKNVNVDKLKAHPANPRQGDVGAIYESIQANGFYGAVVVQKSTGYVLAGNHRLKAAREAGMDSVPVAYVDVDDERAMRILLADNRTNDLASYDDSALAELLEHLASTDDGLTGTGYDGDALDDLLKDLGQLGGGDADPEAKIDKAAELKEKWGTASGDLWEIPSADGKRTHRLLCGDSTDAGDVAAVLDGAKIGLVLTDPPYGQDQAGVTNDEAGKHLGIINGAAACLPMTDTVCISFASPRTFPVWLDAIRSEGHKFERMLWLYKAAQMTFPWRGWILKSESILVSTTGKPEWREVSPYAHDCYYKSEVSGELKEGMGWHGSVKPLDVVQDLCARVGGDVFEPFTGSGTTFVAAENEGRTCYGIEIDPAYVAVCLERMADMGLEPRKVTEETLAPA